MLPAAVASGPCQRCLPKVSQVVWSQALLGVQPQVSLPSFSGVPLLDGPSAWPPLGMEDGHRDVQAGAVSAHQSSAWDAGCHSGATWGSSESASGRMSRKPWRWPLKHRRKLEAPSWRWFSSWGRRQLLAAVGLVCWSSAPPGAGRLGRETSGKAGLLLDLPTSGLPWVLAGSVGHCGVWVIQIRPSHPFGVGIT